LRPPSFARLHTPAPDSRRLVGIAAAILILAAGCGDDIGGPKLLNGQPAPRTGMSLAEATRVRTPRPILVHGYLSWNDVRRLCTRLEEWACIGPSIEIRGLDPKRVVGVKEGCCSVGYWTDHELVIRGVVVDRAFYVLKDAS
jgi:hypothetical protein